VRVPAGFLDYRSLTPEDIGRYLDDRLEGRPVRFTEAVRLGLATGCGGDFDRLRELAHALYERGRTTRPPAPSPVLLHVACAPRSRTDC
jgi:hypothetical protein